MSKVSIVEKALEQQGIKPSQVSRNKAGQVLVRRGYFYRHGSTAEGWRDRISDALKLANVSHTVIDYYDHFVAFKGGAPVAKQSHFCVVLEVQDE